MLVNWPPSKGEKPLHLQCKEEILVPKKLKREDIAIKLTDEESAERRSLLEAVLEHHGDEKVEEQIGRSWPVRKPGRKQEKIFFLNHHVKTLSSLTVEQADGLIFGYGKVRKELERDLPIRPLTVSLTYPLTIGSEVEIKPALFRRKYGNGKAKEYDRMSLGYFLWMVAQEYRRIYADWKYYRPWGHGIEDLYFEVLEIRRGGKVSLGVGS